MPSTASVDVVIPVYNEERDLPRCIARLHPFLTEKMDLPWRIVIADNGSTDRTLGIAQELSQQNQRVTYVHLPEKGRGRALRKAWLESQADVLSYMDVDLSTDLSAFPPLVAAIAEEGYDLAIGTRLGRGARTTRSLRREITSRGYNLVIKAMFNHKFSDAQCGFKAISRGAAQALVPLVEDNAWFFDTELLLRAERRGYRIKEIPVTWVEDPDSRVKVVQTALEDLKGLWRLRRKGT